MRALVLLERAKNENMKEYLINQAIRRNFQVIDLDKSLSDRRPRGLNLLMAVKMIREAAALSLDHDVLVVQAPLATSGKVEEYPYTWTGLCQWLLLWGTFRFRYSILEMEEHVGSEALEYFHNILDKSIEARSWCSLGNNLNMDPKLPNLAGGVTSNLVLVGDKHNHKGFEFPVPFLSGRNSSGFLHDVLRQTEVKDAIGQMPICFNANDDRAEEVLAWLEDNGPKGYVALGRDADSFLGKHGIPCTEVQHPSFGRRFKCDKVVYGLEIIEAALIAKAEAGVSANFYQDMRFDNRLGGELHVMVPGELRSYER